jgi:hypothetical protein
LVKGCEEEVEEEHAGEVMREREQSCILIPMQK